MNNRPITVHTLESIMARTVEEGECLLWTGPKASDGLPIVHIPGKKIKVRRLMLELQGRTPTTEDFVGCTCGNDLCLNQLHIKVRTRSEHAIFMNTTPNRKNNLRDAKSALTWRESGRTKINIEIAREIRCSSDSAAVESQKHGIGKSLIAKIRRGEAWREFSTPFSGLGAR